MTARAATVSYPREGFGPPKDRTGSATGSVGLPAGTEVFSADDHISLAEDIFYEQFPASHEGPGAPRRARRRCAGWSAVDGTTVPAEGVHRGPDAVRPVGRAPPPATSTPGSRELDSEGIHRELAFPNALLALMGWPDKEVRELCFRIYNEHIAELQERSNGRIFGVGLINWWDGDGCRRTLAEMKAARPHDVPGCRLKPGAGDDGKPIDYNSPAMDPVWEAIEESGIPVSHHIGESPPASPSRATRVAVGMVHNVGAVPRDVRRVRLRRDPRPPPRPARRLVRGRHQLGPGGASRTPSTSTRRSQHIADLRDRARRRSTTGTSTCTPRSWSTRWASS